MDVDDAVATLYGLPLGEFVAARDQLAKRLRSEGEAEAARVVKALPKPTTAAWLVNQLVRHHPSKIDELIALGEQMREAAAAHEGRRLRELTAERGDVIAAVLGHARDLAAQVGQRMTDETAQLVDETLHAAMADPVAGDQLRVGRLSRTLRHVGFGTIEDGGGPADVISLAQARTAREQKTGTVNRDRRDDESESKTRPTSQAKPKSRPQTKDRAQPKDRAKAEARADAERDATAARSLFERATALVDRLVAELDEGREDLVDAESEVSRLRTALREAEHRLGATRSEVRRREAEVDEAHGKVERARRRMDRAERRLGQFDRSD